jgi:hypothetical protein
VTKGTKKKGEQNRTREKKKELNKWRGEEKNKIWSFKDKVDFEKLPTQD